MYKLKYNNLDDDKQKNCKHPLWWHYLGGNAMWECDECGIRVSEGEMLILKALDRLLEET